MTSPLLLLVLLLATPAPAAAPPTLASLLATYDQNAHFRLPPLAPEDLERLEAGKLVKIREVPGGDGPVRVVGLLITDAPRDLLWLANRDTHYSAAEGATEVLLTPRGRWPQVWYQHIDAPLPFSDRHWTIDVADTHALAEATGGRCWEHWWQLRPDGLEVARQALNAGRVPGITPEVFEASIYTPANRGAWLMCSLGDGRTLLGYHVSAALGGRIPERVIADWGMATLGGMFRRVEQHAAEEPEHYTGDHYIIQGGDGGDLPRY